MLGGRKPEYKSQIKWFFPYKGSDKRVRVKYLVKEPLPTQPREITFELIVRTQRRVYTLTKANTRNDFLNLQKGF